MSEFLMFVGAPFGMLAVGGLAWLSVCKTLRSRKVLESRIMERLRSGQTSKSTLVRVETEAGYAAVDIQVALVNLEVTGRVQSFTETRLSNGGGRISETFYIRKT